jgi:hypothetical protein
LQNPRQEKSRRLFDTTAGLVLAQVVDPAAAQEIAGMIAGIVP